MGSKFVLCPSEAASSAVKGGKAVRFKAVTLLLMSDMLMELMEARVPCAGGGVRFSADRNRRVVVLRKLYMGDGSF